MTEEHIKAMLNGIINNGEKWECRPIIKANNAFDLEEKQNRYNFKYEPYKLGDEIHADWEYRKVETWCVTTQKEIIELNLLKSYETPIFIGTKEECEKWIEEHTNTWLKKEIAKSRLVKGEDIRIISTVVSKKILEEIAEKQSVPYATCEPIELTYDEIKQIIKDLGIEL